MLRSELSVVGGVGRLGAVARWLTSAVELALGRRQLYRDCSYLRRVVNRKAVCVDVDLGTTFRRERSRTSLAPPHSSYASTICIASPLRRPQKAISRLSSSMSTLRGSFSPDSGAGESNAMSRHRERGSGEPTCLCSLASSSRPAMLGKIEMVPPFAPSLLESFGGSLTAKSGVGRAGRQRTMAGHRQWLDVRINLSLSVRPFTAGAAAFF